MGLAGRVPSEIFVFFKVLTNLRERLTLACLRLTVFLLFGV